MSSIQGSVAAKNIIGDIITENLWIKDADTFKKLLENIPVIISVYTSTKTIYVNSTWKKKLGYTLEEAQKMAFWDIIHPEHREMVKTYGQARLNNEPAPTNYEFKVLTKNGETLWVNVFFSVIHFGDENIAISGSTDITESKRLKQALQAAHDKLEIRVMQRTEELNRLNESLVSLNQSLNDVLCNMTDGAATIDAYGNFEIISPFFTSKDSVTFQDVETRLKDLFISGAFDFLNNLVTERKPFKDKEVKLVTPRGTLSLLASGTPILGEDRTFKRGIIIFRPIKEIHKLVNRFSGARATFHFEDIITDSPQMMELVTKLKTSPSSMSNVLIGGESGTGKELFAQAIHNASSRRRGPFVAVNCGAIPRELIGSELFGYAEGAFTGAKKGGNPGKFELANGGTIFLDEIGDLPFDQQATLLRVVQEKNICRIGGRETYPVDVRIICATNKDLLLEMNRGRFRNDLYYRLNVISVKIPPLRERKNDVLLLFRYFLKKTASQANKKVKKISADVEKYLLSYDWPGNVRELQNVVEFIVNNMYGSSIEVEHLPKEIITKSPEITSSITLKQSDAHSGLKMKEARTLGRELMATAEKNQIIELLKTHGGNITRVAKEIGVARSTIYNKMR